MKYGQIRDIDVANGPGIRTSIFVTGCHFNCYNCFNKEYQDFDYGNLFTEKEVDLILNYLSRTYSKGLSILGGEPMEHAKSLSSLIDKIRPKLKAHQDIWVWSGYTFEKIIEDKEMLDLLTKIDVLVDGPYIEKLKDLRLKFRGSSNQRIIDVVKSLDNKEVILFDK